MMSHKATQKPFDKIDNNNNANEAEKSYQQNGTILNFRKPCKDLLNESRFQNHSILISPPWQRAVCGTRPKGAIAVAPLHGSTIFAPHGFCRGSTCLQLKCSFLVRCESNCPFPTVRPNPS